MAHTRAGSERDYLGETGTTAEAASKRKIDVFTMLTSVSRRRRFRSEAGAFRRNISPLPGPLELLFDFIGFPRLALFAQTLLESIQRPAIAAMPIQILAINFFGLFRLSARQQRAGKVLTRWKHPVGRPSLYKRPSSI